MAEVPVSAGVRLARLHIAFSFALTPVTFGSLVVYVLASQHMVSYWWLALTLGWAVVPLAILARVRDCAPAAKGATRPVTFEEPAVPV